ncbi:manganese-dependent inorganic pyrophosphatase [Lapidilactobacillus wuchangensis]|uniref:manganese-dependent inorganic pyrophosphatase n=1 Tax=Lapidilactobacillus wuchangensis TaxID=2486001 RepID=UPI000F76E8DE|nr:manganese-dependent inorganic pyrophosphatase [Lapidilactobacillus wuchangensis]
MAKELVFGHQNPDTDAIVAAMSYAYLQNQLGLDVEAVALGEPNEETVYALKHFETEAPRAIKTAANEVKQVMLVDHNEPQQSVSDIADVEVSHVVDHHRISNFNTANPLYYRAEPVGCTSTILWEMYNEKEIAIPTKIAGLMLSAIISDTLLLKSPTTTDVDRQAVEALAKIAGVDYQSYGLDLLKAGTNLDSKSEAELIDMDAKSFDMNGKSVRIAQVNTVDIDSVLARKAAFEKVINQEIADKNYDLFVLIITNILNSDSEGLILGSATGQATFEKAFGKKLADNLVALPGVVSRKKQVVPPLTEAY